MRTYELTPLDKKSFYGKCFVEDDGEIATLVSYSTRVAEYNYKTGRVIVHGWFSMTTARHINAFLDHFGFDTATKKQMEDPKHWEDTIPQHEQVINSCR